jgi:RNA polymerase sigma-70 factor, ECF subfamily
MVRDCEPMEAAGAPAAKETETSDWSAWLIRAQRGDLQALDRGFQSVQKDLFLSVYGIVRRDPWLAQDVVQETFLRVLTKLATFDPTKASGKTWIKTIAFHLAVDALRAHRPTVHLDGCTAPDGTERSFEPAGKEKPPDEVSATNEILDLLYQALARLEPDRRTALEQFYFKGADYRHIAKELGRTEKAIGPLLTRARDDLRGLLSPALADWLGWLSN